METILYKKETIFLDWEQEQDYQEVFQKINAKKVFGVCSESAVGRYGNQLFQNSGIEVTWFSQFSSNPAYEDVKKGVGLFQEQQYDAVVSIGGGSAIDVAKAILAFSNMDPSKDYMEQEITESGTVHLAVPTTAGTGSESTHFAVIYVNGEKKSISHGCLLPDYALLQPAYLDSLPEFQKKCTMMDALCQAIESYWSVNSTEESKEYAKEAIDIILSKMASYLSENTTANGMILKAANLAGRAIDITKTTAAHAMSYKLTSLYGIPHGYAVAVCLPYVWEMFLTNLGQCADKRGENYLHSVMRDLQALFGADSWEHAIMRFQGLLAKLGMNMNQYVLGGNLEELVASVNVQRLGNFPIHLSEQDLRHIYQKVFEQVDESNPDYAMADEVSSRFKSLKRKKFKLQGKMLGLSIQNLDSGRRLETAWIFHRCLEYMLDCPEDGLVAEIRQERHLLWGTLGYYVNQMESGLHYVGRVKALLSQLEEKYAPAGTDKLVEKLCSVIPMDAKKMYLYVREAGLCSSMADEKQLEEIRGLLGFHDISLLQSVFSGLRYQYGLYEYHYFTEEEEQELSSIMEHASVPFCKTGIFAKNFQEIFWEKAEDRKNYDILCWQYFTQKNNRVRINAYFAEIREEQVGIIKELADLLKGTEYALGLGTELLDIPEYTSISQGITIAVSGNLAAVSEAIQKSQQLETFFQEDILYVYRNTTKWLHTEDDGRGLGIHVKLQQGENHGEITVDSGEPPYYVEINGNIHVFNEALPSSNDGAVSIKKKSGVKKYLKTVKKAAMEETDDNLFLKEMFRRLLEFKRKVTYTLKYKYKFEVDDKIVLFESYHGEHYNCNPRGVYEAMLKDERYLDYTFVWAFKEPERYKFLEDNFSTIVVKSTSKKYYKYCASAKYIVLNLLLRPQITLKKEQTYIQTWHGKPIKTIGCGKRFETDPRRRLKDTYQHFTRNGKRITKLISPSDAFSPIMGQAFNFPKLRKNGDIVEAGYPRNDELFRYTPGDIMRIKQRLGVDPGKKVILYAPTWRELFSNYIEKEDLDVVLRVSDSIDFEKLQQQLGDGCQILFRAHHLDAEAMDISQYGEFIIDATEYENVNDLYIISDLMISDYSGTIFDFGVLKRPMVFYMFDRELYTTKLQGVNIDLDELPGIFVEKEEDLAPAIKKQLAEFEYDEKYEQFNQKYNQYDDGHSGQRVIDKCMPDTVSHKTLTTQAVKKFIKRNTLFLTKPLKKLKLNFKGFLREHGIIKDENSRKILALKNKYPGQRCFLIGNGPSLKAEDLDLIASEVTFGCNMVYKMFDKTKWRPTYHFIVDIIYTKNLYREIKNNIKSPMITHNIAYNSMKQKPGNITYVNTFSQEDYQIRGNMLAYYIPARATVMSFMIEMAMFMGFKEIYLLGTDCTNSFTSGHFGEEYVASDLDKVNLARARRTIGNPNLTLAELGEYRRERSIMAYEKIAKYADKVGVKIYNTTRGGALEVFPRKKLEDVLNITED